MDRLKHSKVKPYLVHIDKDDIGFTVTHLNEVLI